MTKKRLVGILASAALVAGAVLVPSAHAEGKTIVVWADDVRGPQLKALIDGKTDVVPGYTVQIKFFSSLDALQSAWDKASASGGPDVMTGPASMASQGAKSGKLVPFTFSNSSQFAPSSLGALSYQKRIYGVPLDVDTTAMAYNTALYGTTAPATFADMVDYYNKNKVAKGLTGGICAADGTWGSQPILTALGGGAYGYKGTTPNYSDVKLNSSAFKANVKKYLLDSAGKSTGFFQWDGCGDAFKAGKIPFATTGAWNFTAWDKAGVKFNLTAVPGLTSTAKGAQWVNYSGAYLTSYAASHGVGLGARQLVTKWFASAAGQTAMYKASKRPPANTASAAAVTDPITLGVAQASKTGIPQISPVLDNKAGGTNWYDTLGALYKDIFVTGKDSSAALDAAAAIVKKNFADAANN